MRQHAEDAIVVVRLKPRAGADRIEGERNGVLEVRVKAPPVDGEANRALLRLIARQVRRPPSSLDLIRGQRGREKHVLIPGADAAVIERMLVGGDE